MLAMKEILTSSNLTQAPSKDVSKREHPAGKNPNATLYARLRRLEQRVIQYESQLSTVRRDTWRIEQKMNRLNLLPAKENKTTAPGASPSEELAGLFG